MHEVNRLAWDEAAVVYERAIESDVALLKSGRHNLMSHEVRNLGDLSVWCSRAIHLQCAGGLDTLSLWKLGAKEIHGVDISERMIDCARRKAHALQAPARWYRSDVLDAPHTLDATADLVYTGKGALGWIQDLDAYSAVVARLLKPGGTYYCFEGHPLCGALADDCAEVRLAPNTSYFSTIAEQYRGWSDQYIGDLGKPRSEHLLKFERQWTLGQILTALAHHGLRLVRLEEHPDPFWNQFPRLDPGQSARIPHTFSLLMRKA
jgi:ubiquinone/menaquinone biosynthesis C-methylase UbiE